MKPSTFFIIFFLGGPLLMLFIHRVLINTGNRTLVLLGVAAWAGYILALGLLFKRFGIARQIQATRRAQSPDLAAKAGKPPRPEPSDDDFDF